jgi:uncharacterized protein (DUF1501 family)
VLVVIFQRGGLDGLSVVPPHGDDNYYRLRPNIALPKPGVPHGVLPLDEHLGLHPGLEPLWPLWKDGSLAVVTGVGMPHATRSHFDMQDFVDAGTPGDKTTPDGWVNRALGAVARPARGNAVFRTVALQPTLPRSLFGAQPALSLGSLADFHMGPSGGNPAADFSALYADAVDQALRSAGSSTFAALKDASDGQLAKRPPQNGAVYPQHGFAKRLQDIARLVHADLGLQVAVTDVGGWDTHVGQGAQEGQLANRLRDFAEALAAFLTDLGPKTSDVCVVTVTEFGRTVKENGNKGTDHGTASVMLVTGSGVKGGRLYGAIPELKEVNLFEARDVPVSVDFRQVFLEALHAQLGPMHEARVFPGYEAKPLGLWTTPAG